MQRDWELIRKIVLEVEGHPDGYAPDITDVEGYTQDQVAYHKYLVVDSGLAVGSVHKGIGANGPEGDLEFLTSAGHDFAEACRNNTVWNTTMKLVKEKAGTVTGDVLKALLVTGLKSLLGM